MLAYRYQGPPIGPVAWQTFLFCCSESEPVKKKMHKSYQMGMVSNMGIPLNRYQVLLTRSHNNKKTKHFYSIPNTTFGMNSMNNALFLNPCINTPHLKLFNLKRFLPNIAGKYSWLWLACAFGQQCMLLVGRCLPIPFAQ